MTEENVAHRVIVRLIGCATNSGNVKSGLVRISNAERLQRENKTLRKELKFWIPLHSQNNEICIEMLERTRIESKEFDDLTSCVQYIRSSIQKRVVLILYNHYASNRKIANEFTKFSQIIAIYRCISEDCFSKWYTCRIFENQPLIGQFLSRRLLHTPIKQLDDASQLLLMQICLTELIINLPRTNEAKQDFLKFCRETYRTNSTYMSKIEEFERTYDEPHAIQWYSAASSFVCQIVSKTCALMDFAAFFRIRFILRDLYTQLQQLHEQQLANLLRRDLIVYRGKKLSKEEVNRLKIKGELFVTRNFLSTSIQEDVAGMFSGEGTRNEDEISVLICMHIEQTEVQEKPIAFIGEMSFMQFEDEVMLPMGLVFRTESYEEINDDEAYAIKINMVRGNGERQIEKEQGRYRLLTETGQTGMINGMAALLKSMKNNEYVEEFNQLISNSELAEQLRLDSSEKSSLSSLNNVFLAMKQHPIYLTLTFIGIIIVIAAIVTPLVILLPSNSITPIAEINVTEPCIINTFKDTHVLEKYQASRININCSLIPTNMVLILNVDRTHNEKNLSNTHFPPNQLVHIKWDYLENPPTLTYTWTFERQEDVVDTMFYGSVLVRFLYEQNGTRLSNNDSWEFWFQITDGANRTMSGSFD
ncbi:unnamed protein product [Adineta ricciae]|uniref:Uncharacterized protein n=1 Tax=Adineta ricciae TaxID=249248 RepID=A0A816CCC6_ADIRI|nr:unnamed protein product [Adineta ricciae]CAF1620982.1 unnamed protein product [Adineta ricciae]